MELTARTLWSNIQKQFAPVELGSPIRQHFKMCHSRSIPILLERSMHLINGKRGGRSDLRRCVLVVNVHQAYKITTTLILTQVPGFVSYPLLHQRLPDLIHMSFHVSRPFIDLRLTAGDVDLLGRIIHIATIASILNGSKEPSMLPLCRQRRFRDACSCRQRRQGVEKPLPPDPPCIPPARRASRSQSDGRWCRGATRPNPASG